MADYWHVSSSMNSADYKKYHESFMQNNQGSGALHTFLCIFFTVKCAAINSVGMRTNGALDYILEYVTIVLPMILAHTSLSQFITFFNYASSVCLLIRLYFLYPQLQISKCLQEPNTFQMNHIQSISFMRGLTYLITVFAILAVDFKSFPRHLAKTEKYGFSFMDTGVGLFVLMSGLVHKNLTRYNGQEIIKSNTKFITMLITLGIARFWSVKSLDYQEHITEYGVHWNFFFTLAVCKFSSLLILSIANKPLLFAVLTLLVHETLLYSGLENWVFSNTPRNDFLSANREGLSSCLGYTFLYLFAVFVKQQISDKTVNKLNILLKLIAGSILFGVLTVLINHVRPASRTLANTSYCLFVCATCLTVLGFLYFIESVFQNKEKNLDFKLPSILTAVNNNGLIYFLAANLFTGTVNMSIRTFFASKLFTFVILNLYMIATLILVLYLQKKGIKL